MSRDNTKAQNYMFGAAILGMGVVIMKILGAVYKVPLGNILGDDGYSIFISTYSVYNVFLNLATAGLPIALSRLIAEANAENRPIQIRTTFNVARKTFLAVGLFCALVMLLFPNFIAGDILHNPDAAASLRAMAPSVLLVCMVSAYRGYCQGFENMIPTTVGQVAEVVVKVIVGLSLAFIIIRAGGQKSQGSAGAIFGVSAGSAAALIYMVLYKKRHYADTEPEEPDIPDSERSILKRLLRIGIPIALGSSILAVLNLLDSSICMGRLQFAAGFDLKQSQVLYGVYGKAQTLFNLPAAFITPLTISVVPAISAANIRRENDRSTAISEDSMRIASAICMPMGVGLAVLSGPIMRVMYPNSHESGPMMLTIMGVAAFFVCFVLMENAILQASGQERCTMITMIVGGVSKIVINYFLIGIRSVNIVGAPVGTLTSYVIMAVMNYIFMCRTLDKNPRLVNILKAPTMSCVIMGAIAWLSYSILDKVLGAGRINELISLAGAIIPAVAVYLVSAIKFRAITADDMGLIPGGSKVAKLLHMS